MERDDYIWMITLGALFPYALAAGSVWIGRRRAERQEKRRQAISA